LSPADALSKWAIWRVRLRAFARPLYETLEVLTGLLEEARVRNENGVKDAPVSMGLCHA
jgi:hypothetical protein